MSTLTATKGVATNGTARNGTTSNGTAPWPIVMLRIEQIDASPYQPRIVFDPQELEELAQSVRAQGVQQPVLVRTIRLAPDAVSAKPGRKPAARYELIAGERRLRACRMAERRTLPAIVRDDLSDAQAAELCLLENVQRAGLSAIEEARGYKRLMLDFRLKEERLAKKVGKSVPVLREMMKLLLLPSGVQDLLIKRQLTPAHGHELLRLSGAPEVCQAVASYAVLHGMTAAGLGRDALPNARELEKRGQIVSIDHRTKFDRTLCRECPHKAHLTSGYNSYCLKPDEWKRKQLEAQMRHSDEASRVLEEARQKADEAHRAASSISHCARCEGDPDATGESAEANGEQVTCSLPLLSDLPRGDYRDLRMGEVPPSCTPGCPCRGLARDDRDGIDRDEDAQVSICLDPKRFQEQVRAERERKEEEKRQHFAALSDQAISRLSVLWSEGDIRPALSLLLLPFLDGRTVRRGYMESHHWETMWRAIGERLGIELPWDELFDDGSQEREQLRILSQHTGEDQSEGQGQSSGDAPEMLRIVLLVAALLVTLEAQEAARWGEETPLLEFILEPDAQAQLALGIDAGASAPGADTPGTDTPGTDDPASTVQRWSDPDFTEEGDTADIREGCLLEECFPDDFDGEGADAMEADFPQREASTFVTSPMETPPLEVSQLESVA